ncbi:MAG: hypothetical protein KHY34_01265 [Lachnospiraceae bacterium]|nr:hypothetical protein [Lachnospiraceae bacterium]
MRTDKVFAEGVVQNIKAYLPPELQEVECTVVENQKNNGVLLIGVMFKMPDQDIAPVIYMNPFYENIKKGESIENVMESIADCFIENQECQEISQGINLLKYESVKDYIEPALINTRANQKMLSQMPHEKIEDLSIIYKLVFPSTNENGRASMKITNEMVEVWGVPQKELHETALANGVHRQPAILQDMENVMREILFNESSTDNLLEQVDSIIYGEMFVLSNPDRKDGAAVLAYPDLLKQVDEKFDGGVYILPSSIHECLVVPKRQGRSPKELGEMVREVNATEVDRQEVLSDRVYEFDRERNCLSQVAVSIDRGREMER